jgi:hypothetical protein
MLLPDREHPWTAPFTLPRLYFAEDGAARFITQFGAAGAFVEGGQVLLRAGDSDWSLFNNVAENAKCGAAVLYEQLLKPSGAVLTARPQGRGQVALCTADWAVASTAAEAFWRALLGQMGLKLGGARAAGPAAFDDAGALVKCQALGRFGAPDLAAALATDYLATPGNLHWRGVESPSRDRFMAAELGQDGPRQNGAVYFRCWLHSPRALDDLLLGGPDVPRLTLLCYHADGLRVWLGDRELPAARSEPADYRTLAVYEPLPLKLGWNQLTFKLALRNCDGPTAGTLAVRLSGEPAAFVKSLASAAEEPVGEP